MTSREAKRIALESIIEVVEDDVVTWIVHEVDVFKTEAELEMVKREVAAVLAVMKRRAARLRTVSNSGRP